VNPRITINTTPDGEFEIWLNEEGRDLLVRELQALKVRIPRMLKATSGNDHFHLGSFEGAEVKLNARAYRATDNILHSGKVLRRTDEWDRSYFPHVMGDSA
jgi:hypothetical protein